MQSKNYEKEEDEEEGEEDEEEEEEEEEDGSGDTGQQLMKTLPPLPFDPMNPGMITLLEYSDVRDASFDVVVVVAAILTSLVRPLFLLLQLS